MPPDNLHIETPALEMVFHHWAIIKNNKKLNLTHVRTKHVIFVISGADMICEFIQGIRGDKKG